MEYRSMGCRSQCGACCIAPSIEHAYFGMPEGKPAGVMCVHLNPDTKGCAIWMTEQYPTTCREFQAERSVCGESQAEAMRLIATLEIDTLPK